MNQSEYDKAVETAWEDLENAAISLAMIYGFSSPECPCPIISETAQEDCEIIMRLRLANMAKEWYEVAVLHKEPS